MYKQFCKNLENFIEINECNDANYRLEIAKELKVLEDPYLYKKSKNRKDNKYMYITNLIFRMYTYENNYPHLTKFLWELWGYGFDSAKFENMNIDTEEKIQEKVKLVDLLLGTHYWK